MPQVSTGMQDNRAGPSQEHSLQVCSHTWTVHLSSLRVLEVPWTDTAPDSSTLLLVCAEAELAALRAGLLATVSLKGLSLFRCKFNRHFL